MASVTIQTQTTALTIQAPPVIDLRVEPPPATAVSIEPPPQTLVYVAPAEVITEYVPEAISVFAAGENLSSGVAVVLKEGLAVRFNPNDITHLARVAGVTRTSALEGEEIQVQTSGVVYDAGYDFEADKPCFAGTEITTVVPQTKIIQPIGFSINQKSFFIHLLTPLYHA